MISTPNTILRKLETGHDFAFIKDLGYIQFAIEVENSKQKQEMIAKLKNSINSLYIKTDGKYLLRNTIDIDNVTIHQIPPTIKSLKDCCEWIYKNYTPNPEYALGSIAADDTRIVVNSNHINTDGAFFQRLLKDLTDPSSNHLFDSMFPPSGSIKNELFKTEFEDFEKNEKKFIKKLTPFNRRDYSYIDLQEMPQDPNPDDKRMVRLTHEIDFDKISIYDAKTKKVKGFTEFLWTGFIMSMHAINNSFGPFGIGSVMDLRRLIPSSRVNSSFGTAFADFYVTIHNQSPRTTISKICDQFRQEFNVIKANNGFYEQFLHPFPFAMEGRSIGSVSNVGPFEFQKPIKDAYCQFFSLESLIRGQTQVTVLSKVRKDLGIKRCILQYFYSPKIISKKTGNDLFQTFLYFLQNVKPYMKVGDVYNELVNFRNSLQ